MLSAHFWLQMFVACLLFIAKTSDTAKYTCKQLVKISMLTFCLFLDVFVKSCSQFLATAWDNKKQEK